MRRSHKIYFYIFFTLTMFSGIGLWITEEFFKQQTPYGIMAHPWQAYWLDFHLITLPFTMISLGGLTVTHIIPQLKRCLEFWKRYTGIALTFILALSSFSGYAVQVHLFSDFPMSFVHEWSSLITIPILIVHIFFCRPFRKTTKTLNS